MNDAAQLTAPHYAVVGNPIAHSRSPWIHQQFAAQTGIALHYERLLLPLDGFESGLKHAVQTQDIKGCNVTIPFKWAAYATTAQRTERAQLAQAANTLAFASPDPQTWMADNTDGAGLINDIQHNAGVSLQGRRVLLLGAGGASAGVLGPLIASGPSNITLLNRDPQKAHALVNRHRHWCDQHGGVPCQAGALEDVSRLPAPFHVIINATASSLNGASLHLPEGLFAGNSLAVDMMYGPLAAPFLDTARAAGAVARDGMGMLVEQAAESFHLWHGVRPQTAPVLQALITLVEHPSA